MNAATITSALFRESFERLWPIWCETLHNYTTPLIWWEKIKYNIKQLTIETSKTLNDSKYKIKTYESRLNEIKDSSDNKDKNESLQLKQKINDYYEKQLMAVKIRSRIKYFEDGEKSTKFFFNLERKNISNKLWTKIKCSDGSYSSNIFMILKEQVSFFETLLSSEGKDEHEADDLLKHVNKKLSEDEKSFCDKDITEKEIETIIKTLKFNKSPVKMYY